MGSIFSLFIHLRIPVAIEYDNCVCHLQVKAVTTCPGTQEENWKFIVWVIEDLEIFTSVFVLGTTIKSQMSYAPKVKEVLQDVH